MRAVLITDVVVLDNPSLFSAPIQLEISYQCFYPLDHALEWRLIYVGSGMDESCDQLLELVSMPATVGHYGFTLQADPPQPSLIPNDDLIGETGLLLTCSYNGCVFVNIGYYVFTDYIDEDLQLRPPDEVLIDRVQRNILANEPRVTLYPIVFFP